ELVPPDREGVVDLARLEKAVTDDTILVSVMHSNNEIGTLQPIEEVSEIAHEKGALVHTDAVQSLGKVGVDVESEGVDLLSLSAHKVYGPKGVGALYVREGVKVAPLLHGGGHERGLRSSTENIPGVVGLARALELAEERYAEDVPRMRELRDRLIKGVLETIEDSHLAGHPTKRLPNIASFYFPGVEGEAIVLGLDEKGVAASSGSACSSLRSEYSHVLKAIGLDEVESRGSLRLSLGRGNTASEISYTLEVLPGVVSKLRGISPIWTRRSSNAHSTPKVNNSIDRSGLRNRMYSPKVIEHFQSPHNVGEIPDADGVGTVGNPVCGDMMSIYIKVRDERIVDIKFKTFGCAAAIATSSMITDLAKGKTLDEALKITRQDVADSLGGLPPIKMHCSNLAADALHAAIKNYRERGSRSSEALVK
ncbi:MAG: Fe-S cluster assembly scaffold protein NifU, partial [Candidatus Bathyarchaeia archaeon]